MSRQTTEKKLKECEMRDKYLDLARELKKLWNKKVTIVPIVMGALGTVTKGLLKSQNRTGWARCSTGKCARNINLTCQQMVMHTPAPVLENDTHKLLWDFDK